MNKFVTTAAWLAALAFPYVFLQTAQAESAPSQKVCPNASPLIGTVLDSTDALIPGATLSLDGANNATSDSAGKFRFPCVPIGPHHLSASAKGFALNDLAITTPHDAPLNIVLQLATVETKIEVSGDNNGGANPEDSGPSATISGSRLQTLADDPDDLMLELQQLGGSASGNPANTTITVDGFQGASSLPPKSSIAYIKVNPDNFSAEYGDVNIEGGRVEVYTKPGQKAYHGALFTTNGSAWENARDPYSLSRAAIGKQRYGFELAGPVRKTGSDFALTFEHRIINNFAVVNAITLDPLGNQVSTDANVPTPQSLWLGTARLDWQLGPKNTFISSYSTNVNSLDNQGVGGTTLAQAGYNNQTYEHMLRASNITTATASFMHESRLSLRWDGSNDQPESTAPQISVAGAFTGGGASVGPQQIHEFNIEFDDDAIFSIKKHTLKFGIQLQTFAERQQLTSNFNGSYTFGGGTAPVLSASNTPTRQTETISGIEQYRRTLLGLAGGTPTAYSAVTGTPKINFTQIQNGLFIQDDWNFGHGLHINSGLRWAAQNDPTSLNGLTPRLGLIWSPDKKNRYTLHGHIGLFVNEFGNSTEATILAQNGITQQTSTIYNPIYGNPNSGTAATNAISTIREFAPHMTQSSWEIDNIGGTRALPHGWNLSLDYYTGREWNIARTKNINSPINDSPNGPRPGPANENILQVQNSGQGAANVTFFGLQQGKLKYVQFFLGAVRAEFKIDTDYSAFSTPQSSSTDAGEFAHQTGNNSWNIFGNTTFKLPKKVDLTFNNYSGGGAHYNLTTGFDNNGDGDFNDRPQYALANTPLCSINPNASPCAYATQYGLLVTSGGTGIFPRNKGVLPWATYLDANIQRAFTLTRNKKAEHQQVLTANIRSSNVLNHLNVTAVGGVLGSPLFGVPYAANNGRRTEAGLRYSF